MTVPGAPKPDPRPIHVLTNQPHRFVRVIVGFQGVCTIEVYSDMAGRQRVVLLEEEWAALKEIG